MKLADKNWLFLGLSVGFLVLLGFFFIFQKSSNISTYDTTSASISKPENATPKPTKLIRQLPEAKIISSNYHIFQSFNNCGPASLSMALSYFGINKTQEELGQDLRPYQNPEGINDDKSVTLEEMDKKARELGFTTYHRPNGNIDLLKQFTAEDIPVITRTWLSPQEDIGHYRVVKGYNTKSIIQDDSLEGKNLEFSYADFGDMWEKFNYEYLVLVPKEKEQKAREILGVNVDKKTAWQKALDNNLAEIEKDPTDIYTRFNLSVAYYNIGEYQKSIEEFEKVENLLPFRTLWYQIEPIQAYYELGNYDRVFAITDKILHNQNLAYEQAYLIRGKSYQKMGQNDLARQEFEKAVFYNKNLEEANDTLNSL